MRKNSVFFLGAVDGTCLTLLVNGPRSESWIAAAKAAAGSDTYAQLNLLGDVFERVRADYVAIVVAPALAHDPSHPELNGWFDKLASGRGLCCSLTDGETVADPDWDSKDGHYRVRLDGAWIDVPDDAVVTVPNRAGRTMVWPIPMIEGDTIKIRCFMPGSMI